MDYLGMLKGLGVSASIGLLIGIASALFFHTGPEGSALLIVISTLIVTVIGAIIKFVLGLGKPQAQKPDTGK